MTRWLPRPDHMEQLCDMYHHQASSRGTIHRQARNRAQQLLELVQGNLCGPVSPATPGGQRYFLLLVDDATRYMWVMLLAGKSSTPDVIKRIQAATEVQCGCKLGVFHTDNGGEFISTRFAAYC